VTNEEARVETFVFEAALSAGYTPRTWDCGHGVCSYTGKPEDFGDQAIDETLKAINSRIDGAVDRAVYILRDLPAWLKDPINLRLLVNLARKLPTVQRNAAHSLVVLTTESDLPPGLKGHAAVVEWPLPDRTEIANILDGALNVLPEDLKAQAIPLNGEREAAIEAAIGLTGNQAAACYAKSLIEERKIVAVKVAAEKKRVIATEGGVEWIDPIDGGLEAVGGLENLKSWLKARKTAYSAKAREYGLQAPKGVLLVGVPGCGKSLSAKAIATAWGVPLIKIDLGALKDKFVGSSEQKLRAVLRLIESVGRCVVWLDEIEKALEGAIAGGADGGVSADALGTILTWMQERKGEAFVIATANRPEKLPPEFYRKGRFDDVFFVDLPNTAERVEILQVALRAKKRNGLANLLPLGDVATKCEGFTGSEVYELVHEALLIGFAEDAREITANDLIQAASEVVPLKNSAPEKIDAVRLWSKGKARLASKSETIKSGTLARELDF
jgi:ATP-dependent 26S proteasome regulatory subunit